MIIVLRPQCGASAAEQVLEQVRAAGLSPHSVSGPDGQQVICALGGPDVDLAGRLSAMEGVARVVPVSPPWTLAAGGGRGPVAIDGPRPLTVGGGTFLTAAGPCSVEGQETYLAAARAVAAAGAQLLRGGAYKPRSQPASFQGLGAKGLEILAAAREETGLGTVTEATDPRHVEAVAEVADMIQVGARSMRNTPLLTEIGRTSKPVLLKRAMDATVSEWLCAADFILSGGNERVILCERGVVSFDQGRRNCLDLAAVVDAAGKSGMPVVVDPSHATGRAHLVGPMALAAAACGAAGVLIEVHPSPDKALCDAHQAILPSELTALIPRLEAVFEAAREPESSEVVTA